MNKKELRAYIKSRLLELTKEERKTYSEEIADALFLLPEFKMAKSVFVYISMPPEVETDAIIRRCFRDGKEVYIPKLNGKNMHPVRYNEGDELLPGAFGIPEPRESVFEGWDIDLAILPGVAYAKDLTRLGRGGGYYDRFAKESTALRVGVAYDLQLVETIEAEEHDAKAHILVLPGYKVIRQK